MLKVEQSAVYVFIVYVSTGFQWNQWNYVTNQWNYVTGLLLMLRGGICDSAMTETDIVLVMCSANDRRR